MLYFATLFDVNYLSRGLCLIESLKKVSGKDFTLFVLALDGEVVSALSARADERVLILTLEEVERKYPELVSLKETRSRIEYYFTLSPFLPLYILETFRYCSRITSIDADIYFFSSPATVFNTYAEDEILVTPHDFTSEFKFLEEYGLYNVSFQSFPRTENALSILNDWREQCVTWCSDFLDKQTGLYADQKYLDFWETKYPHVRPIQLKTCGRAPWNLAGTDLRYSGGKLSVSGSPLVYYHFHHLRINGSLVTHGLDLYGLSQISSAVKRIYSTYIRGLLLNNRKLRPVSDSDVLRYKIAGQGTGLMDRIWSQELGALVIFGRVRFFNIRFLKRCINYLKRKINASTN